MKLSEKIKETEELLKLRECGNADHLTDKDGNFTSSYPHGNGSYSIGYLEDLCQWVYYHNSMNKEEKIKTILDIENIISEHLSNGNVSKMKINYKPTWSVKLME